MTEEELVAKAKERFRQSWMYLSGYRWEALPPWQQKKLIDAERERVEEENDTEA